MLVVTPPAGLSKRNSFLDSKLPFSSWLSLHPKMAFPLSDKSLKLPKLPKLPSDILRSDPACVRRVLG